MRLQTYAQVHYIRIGAPVSYGFGRTMLVNFILRSVCKQNIDFEHKRVHPQPSGLSNKNRGVTGQKTRFALLSNQKDSLHSELFCSDPVPERPEGLHAIGKGAFF